MTAPALQALGECVRLALARDGERCQWIPVGERMPTSGEFVLAFVRDGDRTRRIRAFYAAKGSVESGTEDNEWCEYDEAKDEYFLPAGWYEANEYEETHWHVDHSVTHWMPLPNPPAIDRAGRPRRRSRAQDAQAGGGDLRGDPWQGGTALRRPLDRGSLRRRA